MSQCIVPNWNLRHQRQGEQVEEGEERNRSPHVHSDQNLSYVVPMSNHEVTELTWENGQLSLHGLGGILPKQTWEGKPGDTLESIVNQATSYSNFPSSSSEKWEQNSSHLEQIQDEKWRENSSYMQVEQNDEVKVNSFCGMKVKVNPCSINPNSCGGKWRGNLNAMDASSGRNLLGEKRVRCDQSQIRKNSFQVEESACGSASAAFCRDTDTTMMTWASFESPRSLKSARTTDDDSVYLDCSENQLEGDGTTKGETYRSQSSARRSRAAAVHNLSERRRRDRINQKMKTLQKLVPNASKTDKASMLDEVIEYLKQLQAQVHMMSNARNMPPMMMPLGMQQLQMSLLARMGMGMGMGMGMLDVNNLARNVPHSFPSLIHSAAPLACPAPSFVPAPFTMPPVVPPPTSSKPNVDPATINTSVPNFSDAYNTFLAQQSMNMDFLNKMSAVIYRQQGSQQASNKPVSLSLPNHGQRE